MRYLFTLLLFFTPVTAFGQCLCENGCLCRDCDCGLTYAQAYTKAVHEGRPLVVYVKQRPTPVPGCCVCRDDSFQAMPGVVLALPDDVGGLDEVARRDSYPTPEWISQRIGELIGAKQKKQARERAEQQRIAATPRPFFQPQRFSYAPQRGCSSGG
jgi:hypothetical protein